MTEPQNVEQWWVQHTYICWISLQMKKFHLFLLRKSLLIYESDLPGICQEKRKKTQLREAQDKPELLLGFLSSFYNGGPQTFAM